jgi:hypothetical protein
MAKMPFAEDNHMIEAVPPDRTDQPMAPVGLVLPLDWPLRLMPSSGAKSNVLIVGGRRKLE